MKYTETCRGIMVKIIIIYVMEFGHLLTRSGLMFPEVSSKVCHGSFCQLGSSVSLPWVIYYEAFYLHIVSSFSCVPLICPKLVLFLTPSQFVYLFCNLSKCILLFFSCISSLLLSMVEICIKYVICICLLCKEVPDIKWSQIFP